MTIVFSHPGCLGHNMGEGHPERPARMDAVEQALQREGFDGRLVRRDAERLNMPLELLLKTGDGVPLTGLGNFDP